MAEVSQKGELMKGIINLGIGQVALSFVFVLVVLAIIKARGILREKEILIASVRMTIQLIFTGYILAYVFKNPHPAVTILIMLVMEAFAVYTIYQKFKGKLSGKLKKAIAVAMTAGTLSCILYFLLVVVRINPWYDPQYFIPIAGMIVGNSMTGISLGLKSMIEGMTTQKSLVEESLVLGATPKAATKSILDSSFDAAIMPTINSMVSMGIVILPGMMTGQILSGTVPTTAVTYQIAIMFGILGAVSLSVIILLQLGYHTFFNEEEQLNWTKD